LSIATEVQKLEADNIVTLFQLDTTPIGGNAVFNFTKKMREENYISFGGVQYAAIDIEYNGFLWDGRGGFPKPTIQVSNVANLLTALIVELKDLCGAKFTRIRTFEQFLDDGSNPDPEAMFPLDIYQIEQKTQHNKVFVEWQLSSILDQTGRQLPGRIILRDVCTHTYRRYDPATSQFTYAGVSCPYTGASSFNENDQVTTAPFDKCSKRLTGCKLRFGERGQLPTRAFPGVAKTRV